MIVDSLKKSILRQAFQGNLSIRKKSDSNIKETIKNILKIKEEKIKNKIYKETTKGKEISDNDKQYQIPSTWEWVRLIDLCSVITCGYASTPQYVSNGMPFLSAKNVKPFEFKPNDYKLIDKELFEKLTATCKPEINDILLTRVGAGIGESAIIDVKMDFAIYVSLTLIKLVDYNLINNKYILYWLNSPYGIRTSINNITGKKSSQGNLNVHDVRNFLIPLPPIEEQQRIVDKIEELFAKLDEIKPIEEEIYNLKNKFAIQIKRTILLNEIITIDKKITLENYMNIKLKQGWKWVKFSEVADCRMGKTILGKELIDDGIPVYSATNTNEIFGYVLDSDLILNKGDIVIPARGNSIGYATFINTGVATCTQTTIACKPKNNIYSKYLYYCCYAFKSVWFKYTGSAIPQITISKINNNYVPLPPFEEQKKIVERLEKILPLCDDIDNIVRN